MSKKVVLEYIGEDLFGRSVYEVDRKKQYVKGNAHDNGAISMYWCSPVNDPEGVEDCLFELRDGEEIEITGATKIYQDNAVMEHIQLTALNRLKKWELDFDEMFRRHMLGRLQSDCDYYLSYGNRYAPQLWAGDENEQICIMKLLYDSLPINDKPVWISMNDIEEYERRMCNENI